MPILDVGDAAPCAVNRKLLFDSLCKHGVALRGALSLGRFVEWVNARVVSAKEWPDSLDFVEHSDKSV